MSDNLFDEYVINEYFQLLTKENLTEEEEKRKDYILLTAMLIRALGGKFDDEELERKFLQMMFINPDEIVELDKERKRTK